MQPVPTTAGRRVVDGEIEIVAPDEPIEGPAGLLVPSFVPRDPIGFKAGGDHRLGLHRLLIEPGALAAAPIKAVRSDGDEMPPAGLRALQIRKPAERLQPGL